MNLGIDDFRYADLYDYARLRDLAAAFDEFVKSQVRQGAKPTLLDRLFGRVG